MPIPKALLQLWMRDKKPARRCPLQNANHVGDGEGGRKAQKEVNVIRLNFLGQNDKAPVRAKFIQKRIQRAGNVARQNASSVLRTPNHMVCSLVNTVPSVDNFDHDFNGITWQSESKGAIPLATEVASFLAQFL